MLKRIVLLFSLGLLTSTIGLAQDALAEYNELINYTPKYLEEDPDAVPDYSLFQQEFNSIITLKLLSSMRDELEVQDSSIIDWLDDRIDGLALAFYLEGKRIIISKTGGYAGCPDQMMKTITENGVEITKVYLCHSCTDAHSDDAFVSIFNNRMRALMNAEH